MLNSKLNDNLNNINYNLIYLTNIYKKYENDFEIPLRLWQKYLKKFTKKYIIDIDEIGINQIRCKYGSIQTYSIINQKLCFVGEFKSKNKLTRFIKKLPDHCFISQLGDFDIIVVFDESKLDDLVELFEIRKRRKLSIERREELRINIGKVREMKKI
jgi:hypothetical protein